MATYSTSIRTTDAEDAVEQLRDVLAGIRLQAHPSGFSVELDTAGDERLASTRQRWTAAGRASVGAQSSIQITELVDGAFDAVVRRDQLDTTRPCLFPQAPASAQWDDHFEVRVIELDVAALTRFAGRHPDAGSRGVRFTGHYPIDLKMQAAWTRATDYVRRLVTETPDVFEHELIRASAFEMLAATCLRTFPNTTMGDSPADALPHSNAALRRAIAYMEEHVAEPISLPDIAAATRVSPRGLHLLFHRATGESPMRYLRRIRLDGAHDELQRTGPDQGSTIAGIARTWGFAHPSRFAGEYRRAYGEYPRDTLQR